MSSPTAAIDQNDSCPECGEKPQRHGNGQFRVWHSSTCHMGGFVDPTPVDPENPDGYWTHPSWALARANILGATPGQPMFDSDILHSRFVRLTVTRARRKRDLHRDHYHGDTSPLIEIDMSQAQWGAENAYADIGRLVEDAAWMLLGSVGMLEKVVIEEYTIRSRRSHLPHADDLCVYLEECAADNEACENVEYGRSPAVLALAEALAQRMSNEGNGGMCAEQTATHIVTLAGRQPILDGEPWGEPLPEPDGSACHEAFPCDDCVRERLQ